MRISERTAFLSSFFLALPSLSAAFYLPGVAPTSYDEGQSVPLYVNHLTPGLARQDDQLHSVFSYDYYHPAFRFCQPEGGPKDIRESLGSILFGDRIQTSPFELHMGLNETCKPLCREVKFDSRAAKFTNRRIAQGYNINWLVDGLPAAQRSIDAVTKAKFYSPGFALGNFDDNGAQVLHNHYDIFIEYHRVGLRTKDKFRVVGVLVEPDSRADSSIPEDGVAECGTSGNPLILTEDGETTASYTYSVYWRESSTAWATRWDKYLHVYDPKIHWFSLINSAVFVVFLVGMVSVILMRALKKDIARYNRLDMINMEDLDGTSAAVEDGIQEDSGWKLVHGDVFRCPRSPLLLSVLVGNGAQLFMMTGVTVCKWKVSLAVVSPTNDDSVCSPWPPISLQSRLPGDGSTLDIYIFWFHWRIRVLSGVQVVWGRRVEAQHCHDAIVGSWADFRCLLFAQLVCLGQRFERRCTFWHNAGPGLDLVCH